MQSSKQEVFELLVAHLAVCAGGAGATDAVASVAGLQAHAEQLGLTSSHVQLHGDAVEQLLVMLEVCLLVEHAEGLHDKRGKRWNTAAKQRLLSGECR